ncbi:MFS multidrug transporter [Aspergillus sclerotialis]|uniref:MFS multidrug transporter n=1 Tax=Aspergillus sclerotialis TaxID=2070753 RepID=A0A3A3A3K3_9EURO|nr:MFS multidrug transporter [Aspergillus sclerotialis]
MTTTDHEKWPDHRQGPAVADTNSIAESNSSRDTVDNADVIGRTLTAQASRTSAPSLAQRVTSVGTTGTTDPQFEVDWENENDPAHPTNWSLKYRAMAITFLSWNTLIM